MRLKSLSDNCPLAGALAGALRESSTELTSRWLERIAERVNISPTKVFPTDDLLDHVPLLLDGIAAYLENPASEVTTDTPVVAKAMELGALRYAQGFDAYEILKEYEIPIARRDCVDSTAPSRTNLRIILAPCSVQSRQFARFRI